MYIKTLRATKEWRFGVEYFHSSIGDVFRVNPDIGIEMVRAGVAERAPAEEIPQGEVPSPARDDSTHCVFKCIHVGHGRKRG